jgi:hypothetical protein
VTSISFIKVLYRQKVWVATKIKNNKLPILLKRQAEKALG